MTEWKFAFTTREDEEVTLEQAVFESLGAASACWEHLAGAGEFESDRAKKIGDTLLVFIRDHYAPIEVSA